MSYLQTLGLNKPTNWTKLEETKRAVDKPDHLSTSQNETTPILNSQSHRGSSRTTSASKANSGDPCCYLNHLTDQWHLDSTSIPTSAPIPPQITTSKCAKLFSNQGTSPVQITIRKPLISSITAKLNHQTKPLKRTPQYQKPTKWKP